MKKDITDLFVFLDDFSKFYKEEEKKHILTPPGKRTYKTRTPCLSLGEILTIIVLFHTSDIKTFKAYYKLFLPLYKAELPNLPSYSRFVELKSRALMPLTILHALLCEKSQKQDSILSTQRPFRCVTTNAFSNIKYFKILQPGEKALWVGFLALSCTW